MRKIWFLLLATLSGLLLSLAAPPLVSQARVITEATGLDVNSAVIKDAAGNILSHDAELPESSEYTVNYNWSIPNTSLVRSGDTLSVQVPTNVKIPADDAFPMVSSDGGTIGTFFIAAGSHTGTVTLNSYFTLRPLNRRGYIHLAVIGATPDQPIDLAPIAMSKSVAWADPLDQTKLNWTVDVLANENSLVNPVITDQISTNQSYVADSAKLTDELGNPIDATATVSGSQLIVTATGAFVGHLTLTYQTTTNEPTGEALYTNQATYIDDQGNSGSADASIVRPAPVEDDPPVTAPENPDTSTPENPDTSTPENPDTSTPENPGTSTPENPDTSTPGNPGTSTPENPDTSTPENPDTSTPENPGTSTPENPDTSAPTNPSQPQPEAPTTAAPEVPGPTAPVNDQPTPPTSLQPAPSQPTGPAPATGLPALPPTTASANSTQQPVTGATPALPSNPSSFVPTTTTIVAAPGSASVTTTPAASAEEADEETNSVRGLPQTGERTESTWLATGIALLLSLLALSYFTWMRHRIH
ncbi:Ig-like domain-containing protein [Lactiplantibacillus modestisalitolerans]|uniref:Ig-like domain-containing protein n=1 Tax=Lactiplantibacillus modestisalitolerans TaxID=1457219 RepID=A0ABV5WVW2_9LACO|nr:Ig-like domain-containing protein [Lactiplantibacillus modestisalitolerans]